jgi:hypothetical protein
MEMKLLSIVPSPLKGKKWRANFLHDATAFHTDFGASGYQDLTQSKDERRAVLYRQRHRKDLDTKNPTKAGYLSWYILWASPDFRANVAAYKNRFHL